MNEEDLSDHVMEDLFPEGSTEGAYIDKIARIVIFILQAHMRQVAGESRQQVVEIAPWDPTDTLLALLNASAIPSKYIGIGLAMHPDAGKITKKVQKLWENYMGKRQEEFRRGISTRDLVEEQQRMQLKIHKLKSGRDALPPGATGDYVLVHASFNPLGGDYPQFTPEEANKLGYELIEGKDAFAYARRIKSINPNTLLHYTQRASFLGTNQRERKRAETMMHKLKKLREETTALVVIKDAASFITSTRRKNRSGIANEGRYTGEDFSRLIKAYAKRAPVLIYESANPVGCSGSAYKPSFEGRVKAIHRGIKGRKPHRLFVVVRDVKAPNGLWLCEYQQGNIVGWLRNLEKKFPRQHETPQGYFEGAVAMASPYRGNWYTDKQLRRLRQPITLMGDVFHWDKKFTEL